MDRRRLLSLACSLLVPALVAGCVVDEDGDELADLDEVDQALTAQTYWWDQYLGHDVRMMHWTEGFCFYTRITGRFIGRGEWISIGYATDGYWWMKGGSQQAGVGTEARCVPYSDYDSTRFAVTKWPSGEAFLGSTRLPLTPYTSMCYLTALAGGLNGGGEEAAVNPAIGGWALDIKSGVPYLANDLASSAFCQTLGQVGEIRYWGGDPGSFGEYRWSQGQPRVRMAPIGAADCMLTRVTGRFMGGGEWVGVVDGGDGWWYLQGASQQVDVGASARCIDHFQIIEALVRDGGFERQSTSAIAWPWETEGAGSKWIDSRGGNAHSGSRNAWMAASSGWNALTNVVAVQPNHLYRLSAWVRTLNVPSGGFFGVRDANGTILKQIGYGSDDQYQRIELTFSSGANTSVRVFAGYWAPGSASAVALDDVEMTPLTLVTGW